MRRFTTLFVALCAASAIASAQNTVVNSLTFTQGQYRLTLTAPSLSGDLSGTLLSTATGWALGGNALVGAGPSANLIGTTDAVDVQLIAGGTSNVRLVAESGAAAITLPTQTALRLADDAGGEYVGLQAPTGVATYTVALPAAAPTANQVLRANAVTPTNLEWATVTGGVAQTVRQVGNTGTINDVTYTNTDLTFTAAANTSYAVEYVLITDNDGGVAGPPPNVNGDTDIQIALPSGDASLGLHSNGGTISWLFDSTTPTFTAVDTDSNQRIYRITGVIRVGGIGGAVTLGIRRNSGNMTTRIMAGSFLTY